MFETQFETHLSEIAPLHLVYPRQAFVLTLFMVGLVRSGSGARARVRSGPGWILSAVVHVLCLLDASMEFYGVLCGRHKTQFLLGRLGPFFLSQ